eukprot:3491966-Alexandrium_andersonii.AAC.1
MPCDGRCKGGHSLWSLYSMPSRLPEAPRAPPKAHFEQGPSWLCISLRKRVQTGSELEENGAQPSANTPQMDCARGLICVACEYFACGS